MTRAARTARPKRRNTPRPTGTDPGAEKLLKIGEAAKLLGVEAYVLRFWETQFSFLRPRHARSKHRFYAAKDLETLKLIKRLLHQERFTIEGAKKYIREVGLERAMGTKPAAGTKPGAAAAADVEASPAPRQTAVRDDSVRHTIADVRRELESLHKLLES